MKPLRFLALAMALVATSSLSAQNIQHNYSVVKGGKNVGTAVWKVIDNGDGTRTVDVRTANIQHSVITVNKDAKTTKWHFTGKEGKHDYTVTLHNGSYTLKGRFDGKENYEKTYKSDGYPWYQLINYSMGKVLNKDNSSVSYECFLPSNGRFVTMCATIIGEEEIAGHKAYKVKAATSGMIKNLWSCIYYFDKATGEFLSYEGVEGVPGTPSTCWLINN